MADTLQYRPPTPQDLDVLYALEIASYPEDEAATKEKMDFRIKSAKPYFIVCEMLQGQEKEIIGFVNGTASRDKILTHHSMSTHEEDGTTLNIHSVVIAEKHRRKGFATKMLKQYLQHVKETTDIDLVLLLCKTNLIGFYESCGFTMVGKSDVCHGSEFWWEMRQEF